MPEFSWSEITCGEACWMAKHTDCKCSCHGRNHGIWLQGGHPERTCKINRYRYKLIAVGTYTDMSKLQEAELEPLGLYSCYEYGGKRYHKSYLEQYTCRGDKDGSGFPLIKKYANKNQLARWQELEAYKNNRDVSLLWKLIDTLPETKCMCNEGSK